MQKNEIHYYINQMANQDYFAQAGFSDAEWYCMFGIRDGETTGLGQILSKEFGKVLIDIMTRRDSDPNFLIAVPNILPRLPAFTNRKGHQSIKRFITRHNLQGKFVERDMFTDDLAEDAELFPFIQQLQKMNTILIGPNELVGIDFLGNNVHIPIESPNLHMAKSGIENAVARIAAVWTPGCIVLVSAGLSAAVIIDRLYEDVGTTCFLFDCGSIWDAFVGIGGQREWRAKLYKDEVKLNRWRQDNKFGKVNLTL